MKIRIGERIRRLRTSKGFKQSDIADELGITPGAYSKIERGESDPNSMRLLQIAKVLKVSIGELFEDTIVLQDNPNTYGFATKDEVDNLSKLVHTLAIEIKKLRDELPQAKAKKSVPKKSKK